MEFIEIKEVENGKPVFYVIKSLGIYNLSQIEDIIIKQIITEGIEKLIVIFDDGNNNCNKYYLTSIYIMRMQFIARVYLDVWELPRFIRIYNEVMKEKGFNEDFILKSMESQISYAVKKRTEDIMNGSIICEEITIKKQG